ncbi:uncharacterized protein [Penaeus vannamei]|uniref:uncharacterized protein n=1 Tax=Penaeus vannamei TaxID=6689 RepID=UPI00387F578F
MINSPSPSQKHPARPAPAEIKPNLIQVELRTTFKELTSATILPPYRFSHQYGLSTVFSRPTCLRARTGPQAINTILNAYTLYAVTNPRLQRLKEKLAGYTFTAVWRKGKHHAIPDAPVDQPDVDDSQIEHEISVDHGLVLYRHRIVVPATIRKEILSRVHSSHRDIEATKRRATQTVWWPGITNDNATTIEARSAYQSLQPTLQKEPIMNKHLHVHLNPYQRTCSATPVYQSYLVYADRYSGWSVHSYQGDTSSRATIRAFRKLFGQLGVPTRLRTDGGPQFSSHEFQKFLQKWRVHHNMSTPHYPPSNGHAEAHVKVMKHLITKTAPTGDLYNNEDFTNGLLELRSTSRPGLSPAMISLVPTHSSAFDTRWHDIAKTLDERHSAKDHAAIHYDAHAKSLSPIPLGTDARIQNHSTKRWDATGIIVGVGRKRDYLIKTVVVYFGETGDSCYLFPHHFHLQSRNEFASACLQDAVLV